MSEVVESPRQATIRAAEAWLRAQCPSGVPDDVFRLEACRMANVVMRLKLCVDTGTWTAQPADLPR